MRLKRLDLQGFKSFADSTSLEFPGEFTGIVGPNGCGKSNVVDALRWVLGETRPTSMRGSGMTDVIFKGCASRPALSLAEVSVVLDNAAGKVLERGSEIRITRRVFQSGEGEYLIDGERVRLKDVRDMLFNTGLGSRGYAVLEQGKIDAVLSANAIDRRGVFEEAAGISRYRQRKKEAESRVQRVERDLERVDDVLRELKGRVRSLKTQAGKAERYIRVRDEWRDEYARWVRHRTAQFEEALRGIAGTRAELEDRAQALRAAREADEVEVRSKDGVGSDLAAQVDRLTESASRLLGDVRALDERHAQLGSRIESWTRMAGEEAERARSLEAALEERRAELSALGQSDEESSLAISRLEEKLALESESLRSAREQYVELRERGEEKNRIVLELLHDKAASANRLRHLEETRSGLAERQERAAGRLVASRERLEGVRGEAQAASEVLARRTDELALRGTERDAARAGSEAADQELSRLGEEKGRLDLERTRLASRLAALADWDREREGLEAGSRAVLESLEAREPEAGAPCTASELSGFLADHLRTSTRYARALDAALGELALGLVVAEPEVARRIARWLSEGEKGQARLLYAPLHASPAPRRPAGAAPGLGPLLEQVEVLEAYRGLAELFLGDVFLAPDLEAAQRLADASPELRFVTERGELVDGGGLVGGHREIAQGAVGRRSSVAAIEGEAREVAERQEELEARWSRASEARSRKMAHLTALEECIEELRAGLADAKSEESAAVARLQDLALGLEAAESEARGLEEEAAKLEIELAAAREIKVTGEQRFAAENGVLEELERERRELESRRDQLAQRESGVRLDWTRAAAEKEGARRRSEDLALQCGQHEGELERARRLERENTELALAGRKEAAELETTRGETSQRRDAEHARLEELREAERASRVAIKESRERVDAVTRELEEVLGKLSEKQLEEQRQILERDEVLRRASEDLDLPPGAWVEDFEHEPALEVSGALSELEGRVGTLKRDLDRLGPVNTEALDELSGLEERYEFLTKERGDLESAKSSLSETLTTINRESRRRFTETFEDVRTHFQTLFRQLFGGGRADLVLDGEDALEAGIEIVARPPGREMLPIGLLSGGQRTMTALALLFAVFRARPSPFCVLDEVDAALDDANIGRFLAMLDGFLSNTQFVVVTHNKGTMAAARSLYGITMQTRGISRHVSVEFGDVDEIVPEAQGNAASAQRAREETQARGEALEADRSGPDRGANGHRGPGEQDRGVGAVATAPAGA